MGKTQSKEETVIVQNAAGSNEAGIEQFRFHLTTTNVLLSIIVLLICLGFLFCVYRVYKRCHTKWITSEISRNNLRRSIFRQRQFPAPTDEASQPQAYFAKV